MGNDHDRYRDFSAGADNRRASARYAAKETPASLEWLDDGVGRSVTSALKDISQGGVSAEAESEGVPPPGTLVLVRLVNTPAVEAVEAKVVGVSPPRPPARSWFRRTPGRAAWRVRLAFTAPCPYEFFKAAIEGFVVEREAAESEFEGYDPRDWH